MREGKLIGRDHFGIRIGAEKEIRQILTSFVKQFYAGTPFLPKELWVQQELDAILAHFPPVSGELTGEEQWNAALAMTSALPQRLFTADYERMVEEEETPSVKA